MAAESPAGALYADVDVDIVMNAAERHYNFLF